MKIFTSIVIDVAGDKVFEYLCDFTLFGLWNSMVVETKPDQSIVTGGVDQPQIGINYKTRLRLLNQTWTVTYQIIEFEQDRLLTFKTTSGWLPGIVSYRLDPEGSESYSTRLFYRHDFEPVDSFKPFEVLLQKSLARQAEADLANLKDWLESGLYELNIHSKLQY